MKNILILPFSMLIALSAEAQTLTFHHYSAQTIYGDTINLQQYYGKKIMVVNTATYCAYTYQYGELEDLYAQYQQFNFEVIGFPCNDFGGQSPHGDSAIEEVCDDYGVTFQMMSKVQIITGDTAPVYKWLQREDLNGIKNAHVDWNFNKFLIDEAGHWVAWYNSMKSPLDTAITNWIMSPSVVSGVPPTVLDNVFELKSPNPACSSIDFLLKGPLQALKAQLFSLQGILVTEIYNGPIMASQNISYPVSSLPNGIYFLKLHSGHEEKTVRIAVNK